MNLFYRKFGSGQPVIILHGLFGASDNWVSVGKKLAEHFSVYLLDLRNHGQSFHSDEHSYAAMSRDVLEFIDINELKNVVLLGHSMGGKVAMTFAIQNYCRVNKLIIVDISPAAYINSYKNIDKISHRVILNTMANFEFKSVKNRSQIETKLRENISELRVLQLLLKNIKRNSQNNFSWRLNCKAISENLQDMFAAVEQNIEMQENDIPTLFFKASDSQYVNGSDFDEIAKYFPNSKIETIYNTGHWIHVEQPDILIDRVIKFIKSE